MFIINNTQWIIVFCDAYSDNLRRSDGSLTVGMTDNNTKCVYLSDMLQGKFLRKVVAHELVHCFCFSYDIYIPIEQEEFMADWVATYGEDLIYLLDDIMRNITKNKLKVS